MRDATEEGNGFDTRTERALLCGALAMLVCALAVLTVALVSV